MYSFGSGNFFMSWKSINILISFLRNFYTRTIYVFVPLYGWEQHTFRASIDQDNLVQCTIKYNTKLSVFSNGNLMNLLLSRLKCMVLILHLKQLTCITWQNKTRTLWCLTLIPFLFVSVHLLQHRKSIKNTVDALQRHQHRFFIHRKMIMSRHFSNSICIQHK